MNKQEYHEYLKSYQWKTIRETVKNRDGYRCRVCNSGLNLTVHHRSYEHIGNEKRHMSDLITLCDRCHATFHGFRPQPVFDVPAIHEASIAESVNPQNPNKQNRKQKQSCDEGPSVVVVDGVRYYVRRNRLDEPFVPSDKEITLTWSMVKNLCPHGSMTSATIRALGVGKLKRGWMNRLIGKTVSHEQYAKASAGINLMSSAKIAAR